MIANAEIPTTNATKYLKWLCSHFKIKVPAEYTDTQGSVHFPFGECTMQASPEALTLHVEAATAEEFAILKEVVGGHLERFAKKEPIQVEWVEQA